jgi:hypothetical protein
MISDLFRLPIHDRHSNALHMRAMGSPQGWLRRATCVNSQQPMGVGATKSAPLEMEWRANGL